MPQFLGVRHVSTWMIVGSLMLIAMTVHPSLLSYFVLLINAVWMVLTREVSRYEGTVRGTPCWWCISIAAGVLVVVIVAMFKINWLAV